MCLISHILIKHLGAQSLLAAALCFPDAVFTPVGPILLRANCFLISSSPQSEDSVHRTHLLFIVIAAAHIQPLWEAASHSLTRQPHHLNPPNPPKRAVFRLGSPSNGCSSSNRLALWFLWGWYQICIVKKQRLVTPMSDFCLYMSQQTRFSTSCFPSHVHTAVTVWVKFSSLLVWEYITRVLVIHWPPTLFMVLITRYTTFPPLLRWLWEISKSPYYFFFRVSFIRCESSPPHNQQLFNLVPVAIHLAFSVLIDLPA